MEESTMPRQKDLKRHVRARMQKTGEAYTTARAQLLRKTGRPDKPAAPPLPPDHVERAAMSDEAIRANTGRTWREWVATLDAIDATKLPHGRIAAHVHELGVPGWWSQAVAVGYERIRGLRAIGQRRDGSYEATKSRTFGVAADRLFDAFASARTRNRWLPRADLEVSKATPGKTVRMRWQDGTPVEAYFTAKGAKKTQVAIAHRKLASKAVAEERKAYWTERLAALSVLLGEQAT
jgi:hypothetical protein